MESKFCCDREISAPTPGTAVMISTSSTMISTVGAATRTPSRIDGRSDGKSTFRTVAIRPRRRDLAVSSRIRFRVRVPSRTWSRIGQMPMKTTTATFMFSV